MSNLRLTLVCVVTIKTLLNLVGKPKLTLMNYVYYTSLDAIFEM